MTGQEREILLVEDRVADVGLVRRALAKGPVAHRLHVVRDGEEAIAFLRNGPGHEAAPRPDLVLLDLNLPRRSGTEVLEEVKGDAELRRIPVIVFTSSANPADVAASYDRHANSFVTKPMEMSELMATMRSIEQFWLQTAELPR